MIAALDAAAHLEADSELFNQLEKTLFGEGRKRNEKIMRYVLRIRAEQKELQRLMPGSMDEKVMGFLLLRGAGISAPERNALLAQTNYDFHVDKVVPLLKKMAEDYTRGSSGTAVAQSMVAETAHVPQHAPQPAQ